jgi:hypothetical protein
MSIRDFLTLVVAALLIALVTGYFPFPDNLSSDFASMSR